MDVIPKGWKLAYHNPWAVPNFTQAFVRSDAIITSLRARVAELEAEVERLRKGGSTAPPASS